MDLTETINGSLDFFLTSLEGGKDGLNAFLGHWTTFGSTLRSQHQDLEQETLQKAHHLASEVAIIASGMLEMEKHKDILNDQLAQDISHILNDDMEDLVIRDEFPIPADHSVPSHMKPCCEWVLANLHNPYPPKSIRNSICRQTGSSIKDIDAWFIDARKRLGWNHLRRTYFSNKRKKILDAATSFFKPSQKFFKSNSSLEASSSDNFDDHSMVFVEMEERAKTLFSDKFKESSLARMIEHPVWDAFPVSHTPTQVNQPEPTCFQRKRKHHAYPSPERSPGRSPEPLSPTAITTFPLSPSTASHKRRRSSPEPYAEDISLDRTHKRFKSTHQQNIDYVLAAASLPSPAASLDEASSPSANSSLLLSSTTPTALPVPTLPTPHVVQISGTVQTTPSTKRKRASSDSEDQRPSKYLQPASLSRIASNPFPISNTLMRQYSTQDLLEGDLLSQSIPNYIPPFSLDPVLDDSVPLEISCYQFPPEDQGAHIHNPMSMPHELTSALFQGTIDWSAFSGLSTWVDRPQDKSRDVTNSEDSFGLNGQDFIELDINNIFGGLPTVDEIYAPTSALFNDWTTVVNQPFNADAPSVGHPGIILDKPSSVEPTFRNSTEIAAKRERAELLRAELKRLEADIA